MKIYLKNEYESAVYVLEEEKLIYKLDCLCPDFTFRRIKKVGELYNTKYYDEPCKHLKNIVDSLLKQGYKLKQPKEMEGTEKLTNSLRKKLLQRNPCCESCGDNKNLQIHRKIRKNNGGKYNEDNCLVLCTYCHKMVHANEFN